MPPSQPAAIRLPLDVMSDAALDALAATSLLVTVPDDYEAQLESAGGQSEVLGIQRLLTIGRRGLDVRVEWQPTIAGKVTSSSSIYPLLCVLLLLEGAKHWVAHPDGTTTPLALDNARRQVFKHRFAKDMFADSDVVVCADSRGENLPRDLYDLRSGKLRSREDFETLIVDALGAHKNNSSRKEASYQDVSALGVIVAELFENTDMHARLDLDGKPFRTNCLRGVMFKRVHINVPPDKTAPKGAKPRRVDCFEVSVFDSGMGYYSSYTRKPGGTGDDLTDEWKVLHNCLERHYHPDLADGRAGHRAMGLYEVLRAIQTLGGRIEVRTGRLYAYRTFLDGEIQAQMQPMADLAHFAWPKPKLLDVDKKYVAVPSEHEKLVGTAVRVIVPVA